MSKCSHCKPEDYPMIGTPIYGCSCKCHNPAPQTPIDDIRINVKIGCTDEIGTHEVNIPLTPEAKLAIYNLLESKAVDVASIKDMKNYEPGSVAYSFKAVPIYMIKEMFKP